MKQRRAAAPYAKALFALAKERNQIELVGRELGDAAATFESDRNLRDFLARPWIPATAKRMAATQVAQRSGLSKLTSDFLALVAERGRADHLEAIVEKYQKFLDEDLGRVRAHVHTAVPLTDEERGMLSAKLGQALGGRQVVLKEVVDRAMLGGFIVESGSVVVDGSLEGQLERMRRRLASS
ncbi:MAG: ATP synthase F1 subunit delta [Candidatus Rokuibacteriota bacterium]